MHIRRHPTLTCEEFGCNEDEGSIATTACTDCTMLIANGEIPPDVDAAWLTEFQRRNAGFMIDITSDEPWFSSHHCGTCGSPLGGDRHSVILTPVAGR